MLQAMSMPLAVVSVVLVLVLVLVLLACLPHVSAAAQVPRCPGKCPWFTQHDWEYYVIMLTLP